MSASPLEMPPPPPAQVGTPGPPSLSGLAGEPQGGGDQGLQIISQHLMEAEQSLQEAAKLKPELSVIIDKFINETKPQIGQILFGGGQAQQRPPMQAMINPMMAGGMQPGMNMRP